MSPIFRFIGGFFLCVVFIAGGSIPADSQEDHARAKIGIMIKSKDRVIRAKKKERIRSGDQIRIYALPEKPSYVYVIHSDTKTATLLNNENQRVANVVLTLPAPQNFYEIDGKSSREIITVVSSPEETKALTALFTSGQAPHPAWAQVEADLLGKSRIDLTGKAETPFSIAGNVRGACRRPLYRKTPNNFRKHPCCQAV